MERKINMKNTRVLEYYNLLNLLKDADQFKDWFSKFHGFEVLAKNKSEIYQGYHFLVVNVWRSFVDELNSADFLGLKQDRWYIRGFFSLSKPIQDIPKTCDQTIFTNEIYKIGRGLEKAKNWDQYKKQIRELDDFFGVFKQKIADNVVPKSPALNIEDLLSINTIYTLFALFHNTHHNGPYFLDTHVYGRQDYIQHAYRGFIYGMQYIWLVLLDKCKKKNEMFDKLHLIIPEIDKLKNKIPDFARCILLNHFLEKITKTEDEEIIDYKTIDKINSEEKKPEKYCEANFNPAIKGNEIFLEEFRERLWNFDVFRISHEIEDNIRSDHFKITGKMKDRLLRFKIWMAFDVFFPIIQEEIVGDLEKTVPYNDFSVDGMYMLNKPFMKSDFSRFFPPTENIVFDEKKFKNDTEALSLLHKKLYWDIIEPLQASSSLFNGERAFNLIVAGFVFEKIIEKRAGFQEKLEIKIFKHPDQYSEGSISIAIFLEAYSSVSDYSGWLVFYDCATYGYSGFGPGVFQLMLDRINRFRSHIDVEEIFISETLFRKFLKQYERFDSLHSRPLADSEIAINKKEIKKYTDAIHFARGRLFEAIVYKWLSNLYSGKVIEWPKIIECQEIDLLLSTLHDYTLYECKVDIHDFDMNEVLEKIKLKCNLIKKSHPDNNINKILVVYQKISQERRMFFEKEDIKVLDNFKDKLKERIFPDGEKYKMFFDMELPQDGNNPVDDVESEDSSDNS